MRRRYYRRKKGISKKEQPFFSERGTQVQTKEEKQPFFQTKKDGLKVGQPGDKFEVEADAMADRVVQQYQGSGVSSANTDNITGLQKKCNECEEEGVQAKIQREAEEEPALRAQSIEEEPEVQRQSEDEEVQMQAEEEEAQMQEDEEVQAKEEEEVQMKEEEEEVQAKEEEKEVSPSLQTKSHGKAQAGPNLSNRIRQSRGQGTSLTPKTRVKMESAFNTDFSNVSIHTNSEAVQMNKELHSQAFTHGRDIYFNKGKYQTESTKGQHLLAHELTHVVQQRGNSPQVNRKIIVPFANKKPFNSVNPRSQGEEVDSLLNELCKENSITVTGNTVTSIGLCDLPGPIDGNPALTRAEQSKTKTGCTCVCDLLRTQHEVKIVVDDEVPGTTLQEDDNIDIPGVGGGSTVTIPSSTAEKSVLPTKSGKMVPIDPVISLGHELCGHAWIFVKGTNLQDDIAQRGRGGHQATVARENLIRDEQGVERRATFREPFCGEFLEGSFIKECKKWREEFNLLNGTNFKIEDTIPENNIEDKPADFRIDVGFEKDAPQSWFNPSASFNISVTSQGKEMFGFALAVLKDNSTKKFQLEAHASSEKPAHDPDYNTRLSERRVRLILKELGNRNVDTSRLANKEDSVCPDIDFGLKNCSDTEAGIPRNVEDRKVVIRIF